jgi:hypothetical protein
MPSIDDLYPQKWHLPDFPIPNNEFHHTKWNDLTLGKYYYVQVVDNSPLKPDRKGKMPKPKAHYDLVGKIVEFMGKDYSYYSCGEKTLAPDAITLAFKPLWRRVVGKSWTVCKELDYDDRENEYFCPESVNVSDEERISGLSTVFYRRGLPPGFVINSLTRTANPGSFLWDMEDYFIAKVDKKPTWRFTGKLARCPYKMVPLPPEELAFRAKLKVSFDKWVAEEDAKKAALIASSQTKNAD